MSYLSSLCNRLFRKFKANPAAKTQGKMSLDDYISMRRASETPDGKQQRVEWLYHIRLNRLFHVQMHLKGASSDTIIAEATQLLDAGVQWDERQILFHIGGGSIHAAANSPTNMDEAMLRFVHNRGVSLTPLREHAEECRNSEWLNLINRVSTDKLRSMTVKATAPASGRRF